MRPRLSHVCVACVARFGFIECPELASRFKRDIYMSQAVWFSASETQTADRLKPLASKEYKDWAIGAAVSFSLVVTEQRHGLAHHRFSAGLVTCRNEGKPQARDVREELDSDGLAPSSLPCEASLPAKCSSF